jgi:sugar phosphate permease
LGTIAGGFGGYAATYLGWREAFAACGLFGMLYALPLATILRDHSSTKTDLLDSEPLGSNLATGDRSSTDPANQSTNVFFTLLSKPSFLLLVAYFTLPAMAGWVVRDWMPAILRDRFELGQGASGVTATLYWQLAAILGAATGGVLADRWMAYNIRARLYVSAIGMVLIVPAMFGVGNAGTLGMAIAFLILFA